MNLLVAHGGGPTAVINSSLQGVIETSRDNPRIGKVYASRFGVEGILRNDLIDLSNVPASAVAKLEYTPGSAIGSCRKKIDESDMSLILECFRENNIDGFLYTDGNDSMDTCNKVSLLSQTDHMDLSVIGIPKTMDNDLALTDHCPGYGSAAKFAALTSAELALGASGLPIHVVILELMGRNAGWVPAASSFAIESAPCDILTYLAEKTIDEELMVSEKERGFAKGRGLLVVVSEGIRNRDEQVLSDTGYKDGFGHIMAGGTGQYVANSLKKSTGINARVEKPGLIGRSSIEYSSKTDRDEAYKAGGYAVEAIVKGNTDSMVSIDAVRSPTYSSSFCLVPLSNVANIEKRFPSEWIIGTNGISREFLDYARPLMDCSIPEYVVFH